MSDEKLRELERAFQESGSEEAELAWLRERARAGEKLDWESYSRLHELDVEAAAGYLRWRVETGDLTQERVELLQQLMAGKWEPRFEEPTALSSEVGAKISLAAHQFAEREGLGEQPYLAFDLDATSRWLALSDDERAAYVWYSGPEAIGGRLFPAGGASERQGISSLGRDHEFRRALRLLDRYATAGTAEQAKSMRQLVLSQLGPFLLDSW